MYCVSKLSEWSVWKSIAQNAQPVKADGEAVEDIGFVGARA
jgi:hypothetical protein